MKKLRKDVIGNMEEVKKQEGKTFVENNTSLIIFLFLEVLFFLTFGIIKADSIMRIIGVLLAVVSLPLALPLLRDAKTKIPVLLALGLLFIYGVFTAIAPMISFNNMLTMLSLLFAFVAFFILGLTLARLPEFNVLYALLAILAGVALLVTLSLIITFYAYGFLHIVLLKGKVIYLAGDFYQVSAQVKWLFGFDVRETNLNVASLNIGILLSTVLPIIFYLPKDKTKNKYIKIALIAIAAIAALATILLPLPNVLFYLVPSLILVTIFRFYPKNDKWLKIIGYVFLGVFGFAVFIGFLYAFNVGFIVQAIDAIPLVNRVFAHPYVGVWLKTIREMFVYPMGSIESLEIIGFTRYSYTTENFLLDTLRHSGIVAFLMLAAFILIAGKKLFVYVRSNRDTPLIRSLILSFLITYFVLIAINYPYHQLADLSANTRAIDYFSFARSELWLVSLFLLGYVYLSPVKQSSIEKVAPLINVPELEENAHE